jgi:hypothetical protein
VKANCRQQGSHVADMATIHGILRLALEPAAATGDDGGNSLGDAK